MATLERLSVARNTQTDKSADQIRGTARENEASPGVGLVFACSTSWGGAVSCGIEGFVDEVDLYTHLVPEFEPSPTDELHLFLLMKDIRKRLRG